MRKHEKIENDTFPIFKKNHHDVPVDRLAHAQRGVFHFLLGRGPVSPDLEILFQVQDLLCGGDGDGSRRSKSVATGS